MKWWRITFLAGVCLGILLTALWCASMLWYVRTADVLNGTARADATFGFGGISVEYYEKPISWIAFKHGIDWRPTRPKLWPATHSGGMVTIGVFVPLWMPAILTLGLAGIARWRLKRSLVGRCRRCHYDIRAVQGDVCPECGTALRPQGRSGGRESPRRCRSSSHS